MTDHLIETQADGIATLTMNRPEARNAMSGEMMAALTEALPRLAADQAVRVVVLTGAGGAFCAGGDVKGFASEASSGNAGGNSSGKKSDRGGFNLEQRVLGLRTRHGVEPLAARNAKANACGDTWSGSRGRSLARPGLRPTHCCGYREVDHRRFRKSDCPATTADPTFYPIWWAQLKRGNCISRRMCSPASRLSNWAWSTELRPPIIWNLKPRRSPRTLPDYPPSRWAT